MLHPETIAEVAAAIRGAGAGFVVRSGGHDYEGRSSQTRGDLIDLSRLNGFAFDGDVATLGPGLTMRILNERLARTGFTLPMATGATVGLGGYLLGGGLGLTARRHGLASDAVLGMTLVRPDGEIIEVDEARESDLFWALRGGGNGIAGAVVAFRVRLHSIGRVALFRAAWPWERAREVLALYAAHGPELDPDLTTALTLRADRVIELVGVDAAPGRGTRTRLGPLGERARVVRLSMASAQRVAFGGLPFGGAWALATPMRRQLFRATSAFAPGDLSPDAIDRIVAALEAVPPLRTRPSQVSMVRFLAGGGALAEGPGCTFHRRARLLLQYDGYWTHPQDAAPTSAWVTGLRRALAPWTEGAYAGYQDADLGPTDYYGPDVERRASVLAKLARNVC